MTGMLRRRLLAVHFDGVARSPEMACSNYPLHR